MKKFNTLLVMILALFMLLPAVSAQDDDTATPPTIDVVLQQDGRFSTFLAATDASGLTPLLQMPGPYTVLAPTDAAFATLADALGLTQDELLADAALLQRVLAYHIAPGGAPTSLLVQLDGQNLATSLSGATVSVSEDGGVPSINGIALSEGELVASNGFIYPVEAVNMPADGIGSTDTLYEVAFATTPTLLDAIDTANADTTPPDFTIFRAALDYAGYTDIVAGSGSYTLLMPTDAAFLRYFASINLDADDAFNGETVSVEDVQQFIAYHIIPAAYTANDLLMLEDAFVGTVSDERILTFAINDSQPSFNGLLLIQSDIITGNGVGHVINGMLFPFISTTSVAAVDAPLSIEAITDTTTLGGTGDTSLLDTLRADEQYSTFVAAIQAADLTTLLTAGGPYTIFAPTNAAFDAFLSEQGLTADELLANYNLLARTLLYHVVPGHFTSEDIGALDEGNLATGLQGQLLAIGNGPTINGVSVIDADIQASNGLIHTIDAVLAPDGGSLRTLFTPADDNIADALADGETTTIFFAAVEASGLRDVLSTSGPYTVFAPTNDALTAYLAREGTNRNDFLNDAALVQSIVLYHIVPYSYTIETLTADLAQYGTLHGTAVGISRDADSEVILVNDATVVDDPLAVGNGIIYTINDVLIPPTE